MTNFITNYSITPHFYRHYHSNTGKKYKLIILLLFVLTSLFTLPCKAKLVETLQPASDESTEIFSKQSGTELFSDQIELIYQQLESSSQTSPLFEPTARSLARQGLKNLQEANTTQGRRELIQAWGKDPELSIAGILLTMSYLQAKEYLQALDTARKLQAKYPDNPIGFTLASMAYAGIGQPEKAKTSLQKAHTIKPDDVNANINLAQYAISDKDFEQARYLYNQALKGQPDNVQTLLKLAELELILEQPQQAVKTLERAVEKNPDSTQARLLLTKNYFLAGRYEEVLLLTEQRAPEQPALMEFRGKAQAMLGDMSSAQQSFELLKSSIPAQAAAHFRLADLFLLTGDLKNAKIELEHSIQLDINYLPARIGEVKILVLSKDIDQAEKKLAALRNDFKDDSEVLAIAGWFAYSQKDFENASIVFEKAVKLKPTARLIEWWFKSLWSQKHYEQAINVLSNWLLKNPQDIFIQYTLADAYLALHNNDKAIKAYQRVIELNPLFTPALNNLALLLKDHDLKQAISLAEEAQRQDKSNAQIKDTLGTLLLQSGDVERAGSIMREAAELAQDDWLIQYHYAQVLIKQAKEQQARTILNRIIKNAPEAAHKTKAQELLNSLP